jgi:hypothetical protein
MSRCAVFDTTFGIFFLLSLPAIITGIVEGIVWLVNR